MKEKIKAVFERYKQSIASRIKKISINWRVVFIVFSATVGLSGVAFGAVNYQKISVLVKKAEQLTKEEKYTEAIGQLTLAESSFIVKNLGMIKREVDNQISNNKKLDEDKTKYDEGINKLNEGNLQGSIDLLSELLENSFYYQKAQTKIEESKRKVVEEELIGEKIVRKEAQKKAQQETIRRTQEESARIVAEEKTRQEAGARIVAEEKTKQEEAARKVAEQKAASEQLAKEQQQQETAFQKERARQEEKARILELAKTQPMIRAIVNGELKFYINPLPSYAATGVSTAVENTATSLSSWSPYETTIRRVYSPNDADIIISWIRDYGSEILGQAIFRAHLEVGLGSNNCLGNWRAFDSNTVQKILWHELGHSMGYGHSNNPNNIMYSVMDTRFEVESEISKVIPGGYFTTQPLCNAGAYSYVFKTDSPFTGFNLFVLLPGVDPKGFSEESNLSYSDCGAKGMQSYPGSCVVASGAKIYIENTSISNAVKLSGKVINTDQSSWPDMTWDQNAYQYPKEEMDKYWNLFH